MRPIDKGPCPQSPTGVDKKVKKYTEWRLDLIERIGYYCAYCNMPLSHSLNVEHVVPKSPLPGAPAGNPLDWENMLLACGPCNGAKGNKNSNPGLHYLPEYHNGLLAFQGKMCSGKDNGMVVEPRSGLNPAQNQKAQDTIALFKFDQVDTRRAVVDIRRLKRFGALEAVLAAKLIFDSVPNKKQSASLVATLARGIGFFALWHDVFANEPEVLKCLCDPSIVPGSVPSCFDKKSYQPIGRNPGLRDDI